MVHTIRKTKAAVLYRQNKPLKIVELSITDLKEGQVLVRVSASGICHSQLNEIKGKKGPDKYLPHTLGHEGSGIVTEVGPKVRKVKVGDRVILSWIKGSGINAASPIYYHGRNRINSGQISTLSEYTVTAENRVTPVSKKMPFDIAALIGCAVATGMGSIINNARLKEGESVAIYGVGGIGMNAILAAAFKKAAKIIAVDVKEAKLKKAKELGATHTLNAVKVDVISAIKKLTKGKGADYAIECAGLKKTMQEAFQSVRDNGGKAILVGNLSHNQQILIDPFALICGKQIVGSWGGATNPDKDFPFYVDLYLSGRINLDKILTHRFRLEEINKAFKVLESGEVGRVIIEF